MKITGLKKAVGEYNRANSGGYYSPYYGRLMFDMSTGELWTDEFYSIGHNQWIEYHNDDIINLGNMMYQEGLDVTMKNVKKFIQDEKYVNFWEGYYVY